MTSSLKQIAARVRNMEIRRLRGMDATARTLFAPHNYIALKRLIDEELVNRSARTIDENREFWSKKFDELA